MLDLATKKKIGQMLMCGFTSPSFGSEAQRLVDELYVGNFVLFSRNIRDKETLIRLCGDLKACAQEKLGYEPFIAIDEECGMVRRLHGVTTPFPGSLAVAATRKPIFSALMGEMLGKELLDAGINMDFAPVMDVNVNPDNPVIGMRSYGDEPESVAAFAAAMGAGLSRSGVIPVYKHFPGHGDTAVDSHFGIPLVPHGMERLERIELFPFAEAIKSDCDCIMVSHLLFNAIDPEQPATLSKKVVGDFLKDRMGFKGVAITDCMEMGAITSAYGMGEACVRAVLAGMDIVLVSHTYEAQKAAVEALWDAVETGRIPIVVIDEALGRIERLKDRYGKTRTCHVYTSDDHLDFARKLYEKSITLAGGALPRLEDGKCVCLGVKAFQGTPAEEIPPQDLDFASALAASLSCPAYSFDKDIEDAAIEELVRKTISCEWVVLGLGDAHRFKGQRRLYAKLRESGKRIILVSLRMPYDIMGMEEPDAHLCTYEYTRMALDALCSVLKGESEPQGGLPLKIGSGDH